MFLGRVEKRQLRAKGTACPLLEATLERRRDKGFEFADGGLVALIKGPLFNAFAADETGESEDFQMLAGGRLRHAELARDKNAANAVFNEVAVDLGREMAARALQPVQDKQPAVIGDGAQSEFKIHIDI